MQITFDNIYGNDEIYMDCLKAICGDTENKSMLDAMSNLAPHTPLLGFKERTYVDVLPRILDHKDEQKYFIQYNVLNYLDYPRSYSTIICSDGIEHVNKPVGLHLLELMESHSERQIIFTPLGNHMVEDGDNPESHHSGWFPEDFNENYSFIVFPNYHPTLGVGAFFAWRCENIDIDFRRVINELKSKSWYPENVEIIGKKKIAGTLFVRNAIEFDYCVEAAIKSLQLFCDRVYVVDAGSTDGTFELLKTTVDENTYILRCAKEKWDEIQGREKLAFFTNIAIRQAENDGYEYQFNLQADEILHPDSIPYIKQALSLGEEGYFVTRYNLWKDENNMLNVPQNRKPCSTQICRFTKSNYSSVSDAESVSAPASLDYINKIIIFHMGFIRNPKKHIAKIKEIQGNIFQMEVDKRADLKEEFDWKDWGFTEKDLVPIENPLPIYLEKLLSKYK